MMDINQDLLQWSIIFDKKTSGGGIKNGNISNKRHLDLARVTSVSDRTQELAEKLHKPIIRKFNKRKIQSPFIKNIWGANLKNIQW